MGYQRTQGPIYCRYCEENGIKTEITFSKLQKSESGKSIPLDKSTMKPHQCPYSPYARKQDNQVGDGNYTRQGQKEFVEQYRPEQQSETSTTAIAQLHTKIDNLNIAIAKVMSQNQEQDDKLDDILSMTKNLVNSSSPTERDNMKLKQQITELEAAYEKIEGKSFVPANQVQTKQKQKEVWVDEEESNPQPDSYAIRAEEESQQEHDQHVRDMVAKGRQASEEGEELEI